MIKLTEMVEKSVPLDIKFNNSEYKKIIMDKLPKSAFDKYSLDMLSVKILKSTNFVRGYYVLGFHSFKNKNITLYIGSIKDVYEVFKPKMSFNDALYYVFLHELGHYVDRQNNIVTPFDEMIADEKAKKIDRRYKKWWNNYD